MVSVYMEDRSGEKSNRSWHMKGQLKEMIKANKDAIKKREKKYKKLVTISKNKSKTSDWYHGKATIYFLLSACSCTYS